MPIPAKISFIKLLFNKSLSQYFQRDCAASLSFNESDLEYENQLNSIGNDETYLVHSVAYVKKTPSKNILLHNGILGVGVDFFIGDDSPLNVVGNINLNNENNIIQNICPQFGIFTGGVLRDFIRDRSRGFRGTDICDVGIHCIVLESDSCSQANQTYFWEEVFTRLTGLPAPLRVSSGRRSQHAYMFLKKSLTNSEFDFMKKFIRELEYKFSDGEILKFDALKVTDKGRVPGYERFYDDKTNNILTPTGKNQNLLTTGSDSDYQSIDIIDFIKGFSSLLKPNNIYCDINPELKFLNVKHDDKDGDDNKRQPLDEYQEVMRDINFENTYSAMAHVGASHMNINDDKYQVAPDDYARGKKEKRGIIKRYADSGWTFIKSFSSKSEFCDRVNITKKYYDDIGFDLKAEVKRRINSGDTGYLNVGKIKNKPKYSAEEFTKNRYVGRETIKLNGKYIDIKWIEDNFINNPKLWILMLQAPTGAGKTTFLIALARLLNITIRAVAPFNIIKHQKYTNVYTNKEKLRSDAQKLDITDEQEVQNIMNAYGQEITDRFYCMTPEWFAHHVNVGDLVSKCKELSRTLLWFIDEFHIAHKDADFRSAYNRMLYEILHHVRLGEVKLIVASATMNKYMHLMLIKISFLEATSIRWVFFQPTDHQPSDAYLEYIPRNNEADKIIMDLKNFIKEGKRSLTGNLGKILYAFNDKTAWNRLVEAFEEKGWSDLVCQLRGINLFDSDIMKLSKHENKNTIIAKTIINNDKISPKDKITKICERQLVSENTIKMIGDIKSRIEAIDNLHHIIKNLTLSRNDQIKEVLEILTSFSKLKYNNISKLSSYTSTADLIIERLNEGKLQNLNHILYKTKLKIEISETLKYNILLQYIKNNLPKSRPSYVDLLLEEGLIEGRIMAGTSLLVEGYDLLDKDLIEIRLLVTESTMSLTTIVQLLGRFRDFRKMGIKFTIIMVGVTSNSRVPTLTGIDKQSLRILDGDGGNTMMENDALFDKTTHNGKISTLIPYSELLNEQDRMLMKNHHVLPEMLKSVGINVVGTKYYKSEDFNEEIEDKENRQIKLVYNDKRTIHRLKMRNMHVSSLMNIIKYVNDKTDGMSQQLIQKLKRDFHYDTGSIQTELRLKYYGMIMTNYCHRLIEIGKPFDKDSFIKMVVNAREIHKNPDHRSRLKAFVSEQTELIIYLKAKNKKATMEDYAGISALNKYSENRIYNIEKEIIKNFLKELRDIYYEIDPNTSRPLMFDTTNIEMDSIYRSLFQVKLKTDEEGIICFLDLDTDYSSNEITNVKGVIAGFIDGDKNSTKEPWSDDRLDEEIDNVLRHKINIKKHFNNLSKHNVGVLIGGIKRKHGFIENDWDKEYVERREIEYDGIRVKHDRITVRFSDTLNNKCPKDIIDDCYKGCRHRFITVSYSISKLRRLLLRTADQVLP